MPVKSFLRYGLEIPDQTVGENFYRDFGLAELPARDNAVHLWPAPSKSESVLLYAGAKKHLHHLAFGAPGDDFEQVKESLRRAGVGEMDPPGGAPEGGIWIRDPDGYAINIRNERSELPPPDPPLVLNSPGRTLRVASRGCPEADLRTRPRKLGHILLFTSDLEKQIAFYTSVLGLRLTDRSRDIIIFLRCTTDHHNVAFVASKGPGFHHAAFEVGNIDEIAMGGFRMKESGWESGWGPGRHVIGSNFFYYVSDPWGSYAEYYHDLDQIPEDCAWEPSDFPPEDALYRWGPPVPSDFTENKELV